MFGKKAQLTLFMIIGIIIVSGAFFVMRGVSVQTREKLVSETQGLSSELLKTAAFENYVNKCLKKLTKEAVVMVGLQGGKIDLIQGGTNDWLGDPFVPGKSAIPFDFNNFSYYTFYGLNRQFLYPFPRVISQLPAPPIYPYPGPVLDNIVRKEDSYGVSVGIYGVNKLLPLCSPVGENKRTAVVMNTCKSYGVGDYSFQRQIENYVAKNLPLCVDFDSFAKTFAYSVSQGVVSLNSTITDDFISVDASYPLEISLGEGKVATKVVSFHDEVRVRLKLLHEFANAFIDLEAKHLFWNYSNFNQTVDRTGRLWSPDLNFYVINDACPDCSSDFGGASDVVVVSDSKSLIDGVPYELRFAVENRVPVLDEVKDVTFNNSLYDFVVLEGANIEVNPVGFDADEDKLIFNYSGWKADYDEEQQILGSQVVGSPVRSYYSYAADNKWSSSDIFKDTGANASINTSHDDIGPHNFTLSVLDDAGLFDFQVVRVLVNDIPIAVVRGDNLYFDIPDEYASVEDPYVVDGTGSGDVFSGPGGVDYVFEDKVEGIKKKRSDPILRLPQSPDISSMESFVGNKFSVVGDRVFRFIVTDNLQYDTGMALAELPVIVKPCLPHRNSNNPYPYPFENDKLVGSPPPTFYTSSSPYFLDRSNNPFAAFLANHTCCLGNVSDPDTWKVANSSVVCGPGGQKCDGVHGNRCG